MVPDGVYLDADGILKRGLMTKNGKLTKGYAYLQDYIANKT